MEHELHPPKGRGGAQIKCSSDGKFPGSATSDGLCMACAPGTEREGEGAGPCAEVNPWNGPFEMSFIRQKSREKTLGCHPCNDLIGCKNMALELGANAMNVIGKGAWIGVACFYQYDGACPPPPSPQNMPRRSLFPASARVLLSLLSQCDAQF